MTDYITNHTVLLLDRARLSAAKHEYTDRNGRVYIYYPIEDMADDIHKSRTTVKNAFVALEDSRLIVRVHQGIGQASKIYVKVHIETKDRNAALTRSENGLSEDSFLSNRGQKIVLSDGRNVSGSKNDINKNNIVRMREQERSARGSQKNVYISDEEYEALSVEFTECDEYIERLSLYMASTGKYYSSHAATVRKWILQDKPKKQEQNYDCREDESL